MHALQGVDLDLFKGEFVVILGPSGSGKSTLLNILGGLDAPTGGVVRFRDHDLVGAGDRALTTYRREHVGFVFQFYNLIPSLTARENVALVTEIADATRWRPRRRSRLVGLGDRLDHFPAQLSGGEQQRVAIARAIAKRPDVLLCDEPTGALDAETGRLVLETLVDVNRELGTTTAVITHNAVIAGIAAPRPADDERANRRNAAERASASPSTSSVGRRPTMRALDLKLFRELRRHWVQITSIALVMGCGTMTIMGLRSTLTSIRAARDEYFAEYRFGDVFAHLERAPEAVAQPDRSDPAASAPIETRVVRDVRLDVPGLPEPAIGHMVSIPGGAAVHAQRTADSSRSVDRSRLDARGVGQRAVRRGQSSRAGRQSVGGDQRTVAASRISSAWRFRPSSSSSTRGAGSSSTTAGMASSGQAASWFESAFDMKDAFNDVVVRLASATAGARVCAAIWTRCSDRGEALRRTAASDQPAARVLEDEFSQLRTNATIFPLFFLLVAAFLLNVVLSRLVASQREEIAALKAFGYTDREIGWHYLGFGIAGRGARRGRRHSRRCVDGRAVQRALSGLFPFPVDSLGHRLGRRRQSASA